MKSLVLAAIAAFSLSAAFADEELDIAQQALRDGIWTVARDYALRSGDEKGRLIVLESYARESRWRDILSTLESWDEPEGEGFLCYRAMAHAKIGDFEAARNLLDKATFEDADFARMATRIKATMFLASGEPAAALKSLKGYEADDIDFRMLKAEALSKVGERKDAEEIWRAVVAATNVPESAVASAASMLGDVVLLREAYGKMKSVAFHRVVGISLGMALLRDKETFDEGAKLIRAIVHDSPDTEGAKDAFLALADGLVDRKSWSTAADAYSEMLETWPEIEKNAAFQEGRGWVLSELGNLDEAYMAFDRAAELSNDDSAKAMSLVKAADVLSAMGRGADAMARYRRVREEFPKTMAAERIAKLVHLHELEDKGRAQYGEYRFADAQKTFEQIAEEDPSRRAKMDFYAVMCLYGQGLDEEAESKAKSLAKDESVDVAVRAEATLWLAKFAYNKMRWKDAASLFMAYVDLVPSSPAAAAAVVWSARASFSDNDFSRAVSTAARLSELDAESATLAAGLLVQGESLIELARFDEAIIVLERAAIAAGMTPDDRFKAQLLKADALFAMGADNPVRYHTALDAYRTIQLGEDLTPTQRISIAFKIGKTLERMRKMDESMDQYYTQVVLAYRNGREKGLVYEDVAHADFSRAAFRLADEYESRGKELQAISVLSLVVASDVPASDEAARRIERISKKGKYL